VCRQCVLHAALIARPSSGSWATARKADRRRGGVLRGEPRCGGLPDRPASLPGRVYGEASRRAGTRSRAPRTASPRELACQAACSILCGGPEIAKRLPPTGA
jgi:hypothetical protein